MDLKLLRLSIKLLLLEISLFACGLVTALVHDFFEVDGLLARSIGFVIFFAAGVIIAQSSLVLLSPVQPSRAASLVGLGLIALGLIVLIPIVILSLGLFGLISA